MANTKKTQITNSEQLLEATSNMEATKIPSNTVVVCFNSVYSQEFPITGKNGETKKIIINGNAVDLKGKEKGTLPLAGAHGMTFGVIKEDWDEVVRLYGRMGFFRNHLIWAEETVERAKDSIKDHKNVANGFEPIDPNKQAQSQPVPVNAG